MSPPIPRLRLFLFVLIAAAGLARPAAAQIINPVPNAYLFSFLACNFETGCPNPTEFARFTWFGYSPLAAPALGPNNYYNTFRSSPVEILPLAYGGVGFWEHVYLTSYRNVYGQSGSFFAFQDLDPGNGQNYGDIVMVDAYVSGPTRNPLVWEPGLYTGLIAAPCNYSIACVSTPGAVDSVRILVTQSELSFPDINDLVRNKPETGEIGAAGATPPAAVSTDIPEPASALLLGAGLAALGLRRRAEAKGRKTRSPHLDAGLCMAPYPGVDPPPPQQPKTRTFFF